VSFDAAEEACRDSGGELVSVHNEQQQAQLIQLTSEMGLSLDVWIGFTDREEEGSFRWTDGSAADYANWGSGEPNDANGEDCTQLTTSGFWNDLPCDSPLAYICWSP
jgi:hypothetical protein